MLTGAYGSSSRPLRRLRSPLIMLIKHHWLLWTVWLYYPANDTPRVCMCLTSASQLYNDRQHKHCMFVCVCMFIWCVCVCVGSKYYHPWVSTPFPPSKVSACVSTYDTIFLNVFNSGALICSGSAQGLALTWSLAHTQHTLTTSETDHKPRTLTCVCSCACISPWYLVCGMKKSIITAEWKGNEVKSGGKETKKVKLNKFSFLA